MPAQPRSRQRARARQAEQQRRQRRRRAGIVAGAAVGVLAVIAAIAAVALTRPTAGTGGNAVRPAPAALLAQLTGVSTAALNRVGAGAVTNPPVALARFGPLPAELRAAGKPEVLYVGAEYCPYCAEERWGLIQALARFGTFTGLHITHSARDDGYVATFTFYRSTYRSRYLTFTPVEQLTNIPTGNQPGAPLQPLTAEQQRLLATYDTARYLPGTSAGSIPFLDLANRYIGAGTSFTGTPADPLPLAGASWTRIAAALNDPASRYAQDIDGTANVLTAALCTLTADQPASVCAQPGVTTARQRLDQPAG